MTAHMRHGVDRGRATDNLPTGAFDGSIVERRVGLREIHPVIRAVEQEPRPAERDTNPGVSIPAARLDNEDFHSRILGEAISQNASGRAGSDDHIVEHMLLVEPHGREPR